MNPRHRRSPKNQILMNAYPSYLDGYGVFSFMENMPWSTTLEASDLDVLYFSHSGMKFIAPFMYNFLDDDGEMTTAGANRVGALLRTRFIMKWEHLWNNYTMGYNPLHTYSLTEEGSKSRELDGTDSQTRTPNLTDRATIDDTVTYEEDTSSSLVHGETVTDSGTNDTTTEHKVQGFNSSDYVSHSEDVVDGENTSSEIHSGTDSTTGANDSTTSRDGTNVLTKTGTETTSGTNSEDESEEYTVTKSGNAYRSPAELLELDRILWETDFLDIVFADIDSVITLAVYSDRPINKYVF